MSPVRFDLKGKRVYVAGHRGMAGSAIMRRLALEDCEIVTADRHVLDLADQAATEKFLAQTKPDAVFLAAARVGGIHANQTYPADFIADNLAISLNVIRGAFKAGVGKLLNLGSSCIYPKLAPQPMSEEALLTGPLDPTNEWYAIAKIAAIKLCEAYRRQHGADFVSVMPTNLYGPGDNYHPENSHVPAALIRRFHEAKLSKAPSVTVWGTGTPRREFLCADDLADACVFAMKHYSDIGFLNVGVGHDVTIAEFAELVRDIVGYGGKIVYDTMRPDGPPQKLLDVSKLKALGWSPKVALHEGLAIAYADFQANGGRGDNSARPISVKAVQSKTWKLNFAVLGACAGFFLGFLLTIWRLGSDPTFHGGEPITAGLLGGFLGFFIGLRIEGKSFSDLLS